MGRPRKKPEDLRKIATLRLYPEVRRKLENAATKAERSFAADLEARLVATCDLDHRGVELVQAIAKRHGGSVSVRNLPGRGCEFCLRLPNKSDTQLGT
jgi:light-regulated signal transduction histidine kinase (bacteriophytochrome)